MISSPAQTMAVAGAGVCMQSGHELLELCAECHQVYSRDLDIECACIDDDEPEGYEQ